jgi:hypothetical protein
VPKIELTIEAKIEGLQKALDGVGRKLDALNKGKTTTWTPVDPAQAAKDAAKVVQTTQQAQQKIVTTTQQTQQKINHITGTTPGSSGGIPGWRTGSYNPAAAAAAIQAAANRAQAGAAGGAAGGGGGAGGGGAGGGGAAGLGGIRHSIRRRYTYAPEAADIGRSLIGGVGGGVGQVVGYAQRGAVAGAAEGGGMLGGAAGLLKGTLIGAGVLAAFKIGQMGKEGYDMASERAHTLDTLKRQMGDVGVSFDRLKIASEAAATGLAINSKDFAAIEAGLNVASGRAATLSPLELAQGANTTSGFARAYGMDPGHTAGLFGAARNVDPKRQYTEFAGILAQTIERTGKAGSAEEVTQAVLSFAATASRLSMSQANISGYASAYAGLTTMGLPGLTSGEAAGILSQANSAASNMGAAGEAGQAFALAAYNRQGAHLNPLESLALSSGGLFASRASVFGAGTAMGNYLGADASKRLSTGKGADTTVFEMIANEAKFQSGGNGTVGKELQAEMMQRYFGLQSMQQATALIEVQKTMDPGAMAGFDALLKRSGIDVKNFNPTNIATLGKISSAGSMGDLDAVFADMKTRTGTSALSTNESDAIEAAKDKGFQSYQDALVKASANKDYAQDSYQVQLQMATKMDDIKTAIGDTLLGGVTHLESSMITAMGGREKFEKQQKADEAYHMQGLKDENMEAIRAVLRQPAEGGNLSTPNQKKLKDLWARERLLEKGIDPDDDTLWHTKGGESWDDLPRPPAKGAAGAITKPVINVTSHHIVNVNVSEKGGVSAHVTPARATGTPAAAVGHSGVSLGGLRGF